MPTARWRCEVGLPELIDGHCLVLELIRGLDDDEGWAGDEVVRLEQAIDGDFRAGTR